MLVESGTLAFVLMFDTARFMEASQLFLSDLMHFFASRSSGIAIMFLSGPHGSSLM